MPKLYIFAIGGTGSRVLRSLTMLLASGVKTNYDIVPIILDPDGANGDLNRTKSILESYQSISDTVKGFDQAHFFRNPMLTLGSVVDGGADNNYVVNIQGLDGGVRFREFIGYNGLDKGSQHFLSTLFSDSNLNLDLGVGFKGNPNIGSIVLNAFVKSNTFTNFANTFAQDDRIFVIGSIFGGTGAAGLPLMIKNFRNGQIGGRFYDHIKNAVIGSLIVQPYFALKDDDKSAIDSQIFIDKTKAALHYYERFISNSNMLNATYYVADNPGTPYNNSEGGNEQKNKAHIVEMIGALSIIDFANSNNLSTINGVANNPEYKEFGLSEENSKVNFTHLDTSTNNLIRLPLQQYFYFDYYINYLLESSQKAVHAYNNGKESFDINFFNNNHFTQLKKFNKEFRIWLREISENQRAFHPFLIEGKNDQFEFTDHELMFENINGYSLPKGNFLKKRKDNVDFIDCLDKLSPRITNSSNTFQRFIGLLSQGTKAILESKKLA